ncbi:hypothetical protein GCM10025771_37190 [Niveibacterium umoris]|uniref:Leucyl aminopeptidase (Aminopeptidase T) n=1 Tax=Niveibacterium umoris TaxID=1193620 RepID=A0A840BEG1_9RHOO|nr:hypothetical protein [Niveibacterium umoris]MBB4011083.1 leucyl aminopeptidase (aminopeptidase T) [Niveibacterium umoris]
MAALMSFLGVIFSGGATGLIGVLFQRYFDYKAKQQDLELVKINNEHARLLAQMDVEKANRAAQATEKVAEEQAEAQVRSAELEAQARADEAAAKAYVASIDADRATYLDPKAQSRSKFARIMMTLVDFVRGMIRPFLTIYLVIVATVMFAWARTLAAPNGNSVIDPIQAATLVKSIIDTLLYLATTCVVWWFGVRPSQKAK